MVTSARQRRRRLDRLLRRSRRRLTAQPGQEACWLDASVSKMSWQATNWAVAQKTGSPSRKVILLLLADKADEQHSCYPSRERLAEESETSVSTVTRVLRELKELGLLTWEHRAKNVGRGRSSNRYYLNVDGALDVARPTGQSDLLVPERPTGQMEGPTGHQSTTYGSPVTQEPSVTIKVEPDNLAAPADADAGEALPGMPEPLQPDPSAGWTAGRVVAAWCEGFAETWPGAKPVRSIMERAGRHAKNELKNVTTEEQWLALLDAARSAGRQNVFDIVACYPVARVSQFQSASQRYAEMRREQEAANKEAGFVSFFERRRLEREAQASQ